MIFRRTVPLLLALALAGCLGIQHRDRNKAAKKTDEQTMPDQSGDVSFQGFLGRLRTAVHTRDMATMATMMTPNFGYSLNPDREGDGVFQFWDENGTWAELELVLREKFVPLGNFMVAPPQFANDPENFSGYRAGMQMLNGSWKFAYFVNSGIAKPNAVRKP